MMGTGVYCYVVFLYKLLIYRVFIFEVFGCCICPAVCKDSVPIQVPFWGSASLQGYSIENEVETWICVLCEEVVECVQGCAIVSE